MQSKLDKYYLLTVAINLNLFLPCRSVLRGFKTLKYPTTFASQEHQAMLWQQQELTQTLAKKKKKARGFSGFISVVGQAMDGGGVPMRIWGWRNRTFAKRISLLPFPSRQCNLEPAPLRTKSSCDPQQHPKPNLALLSFRFLIKATSHCTFSIR